MPKLATILTSAGLVSHNVAVSVVRPNLDIWIQDLGPVSSIQRIVLWRERGCLSIATSGLPIQYGLSKQ